MKKQFSLPLITLLFSGCIAIRVYVPHSSPESSDPLRGFTEEESKDTSAKSKPSVPFVTVEDETENGETFGRRSPSLFFLSPRNLENYYGTLPQLIEKEIALNPGLYPIKGKHKITIRQFSLLANDICYKNITSVDLHITVESEKPKKRILDFNHNDSLESRVTDCTFTLATAPAFLGWVIYLPYVSFRGNREDQLNQMGRIAILTFFEKLRESLPKK
ncbi:hypothetical protein LPTSP3_g28650 [Leptospira kobayashii]|uniref:Lipoprotein n=1 Tax=Leptospira kobayashii TaxID=1917830 RepID=A0ABN6KM87_9LEPT|nr:hypothetical protein [Leptospira kobayashii]BDA79935.1 hypothetical protein LPTSP3_g28650 [Leptospira kobayashii]